MRRISLIAPLAAAFMLACGVDNGEGSFGADAASEAAAGMAGSAGTGGTTGTGGTAGTGGSSPAGSGGGQDAAVEDASADQSAEDSGGDADAADVSFGYDVIETGADACAETKVQAVPLPLSMYLLLDRSGSMTFANKWSTAVDGITQFVQAPEASGAKVALQYFPLDVGHDCAGGAYGVPEVPLGLLPGHAPSIVASLSAALPEGTTTPLEGALNGISQFCSSYASAPPGMDEKVVGVLVTDGMPDGPCDNTLAGLKAIAAASFGGTPSIPIYVMGMSGADFTVLGEIAASGGTQGAYSVTTGGPAAFLAALEEIRADAVGCAFSMPQPDAGTVDLDQVAVLYQTGSGSPQTLPRVADETSCGIGWYFDVNAAPTTVHLCASTCNILKGDPQASIDISLGCLGS